MMLNKSISSLILLLTFMLSSAQNNCTCDRHGMLVEFTNPHNPDYVQKLKKWRKCMTLELGNYVTFDANDPRMTETSWNCERKKPVDKWYCYPAKIAAETIRS